ncbi:MAG: hypothetical protein ACTSU5_08900 [Promethearchaeota archaeon]
MPAEKKEITVTLEGEKKGGEDDLEYKLVHIKEITGGATPKIWPDFLKKLIKLIDSSKDDDYERYKNLKHIETSDGRTIKRKECLLIFAFTKTQVPFVLLLYRKGGTKKSEFPWEVIAMQSPPLLQTERFRKASVKEKIVLIDKTLEVFVAHPELYPTIHLVYPL